MKYLGKLSIGKNPPQEVNAFIEISKGGSIKYELDKESGLLFVDRFLHTAMAYPFNYGFIPHTLSPDGDPLDILVLSSEAVAPGCVLPAVVIGLFEMEDEGGIDPKIVAVPSKKVDPFFGEYQDIKDVPDYLKAKITHFFEQVKVLEAGKWVKVQGWKPKKDALELVKKSMTK